MPLFSQNILCDLVLSCHLILHASLRNVHNLSQITCRLTTHVSTGIPFAV